MYCVKRDMSQTTNIKGHSLFVPASNESIKKVVLSAQQPTLLAHTHAGPRANNVTSFFAEENL